MKKIFVSQRVDIYPDRGERRDALDQKLVLFLLECGLLPVPVPNTLAFRVDQRSDPSAIFTEWFEAVNAEGVVLSGGNDIGSCSERDIAEGMLLAYAQTANLPVLGICRGMQMMAHWSGVTLKNIDGHVRSRHQLKGEIAWEVNSYHNLTLSECPQGFSVTATSEDGEIEAIRHLKLPWEGWMWHPERESKFNPNDLERTRNIFNG